MANGTSDRCRVCDEPLAPGATFCPRCGTRVDAAAAGEESAMTGLVVDDPTAAPDAYDATQAMPGAGEPTGLPVAGAPVDAGEPAGAAGPTPEEEERARRMRLIVAGIVAVIVIALVVLVALAFTSGGGGGKTPGTSVPSTALTTTSPPNTTSAPATTRPPVTSSPPPSTTSPPTSPPSTTSPPTST
ncbi:MAG TPA: hypothetical protein VKH17_09365 [Acidimicrobiia bacterium]|nr:hypothetical protein [Acidimicrobiia bacterium]